MNKTVNNISVGIPTFNSAKFIKNTIESILFNSYSVNEIIISDDNSEDETLVICQKLQTRDKSIKIYRNKHNFGYQKNWNKCFKYCKSKYLIILHHDDILKQNAIEKQIKFLNEHPDIALVGGQEDYIDENGIITLEREKIKDKIFNKGNIFEFIKETGSYIPCSSVMFDMEKIRKIGFFDENYLAADELFWPKVLTKFPIAVLGYSLIDRRNHSKQTEYSDFEKKSDKIIEAAYAQNKIAEYEKEPLRQKATLKILNEKTARNCIRIAHKVFQRHRDISTALKYLKVSFKEYPKIFFSKFFIKFTIKAVLGKIH